MKLGNLFSEFMGPDRKEQNIGCVIDYYPILVPASTRSAPNCFLNPYLEHVGIWNAVKFFDSSHNNFY